MASNSAVQDQKMIGAELTKWENRLEVVKTEVAKNIESRDALLQMIEQKTKDYDTYMAQKDADLKRQTREMQDQRDQFVKDKTEFINLMKQHQAEKVAFEQSKKEFEIQKLRHASSVQNVQEFVTAVRRAVGVLGI
jgi:hypothetical protein